MDQKVPPSSGCDPPEPDRADELEALRVENAALRRSESLLKLILDRIDDTAFVKDVRGCYMFVNSSAARLLGRRCMMFWANPTGSFFAGDGASDLGR